MLAAFDTFVKEKRLFSPKNKLLLALSGGEDSICLFHLLLEGGYNFSAAHCNFGLRGKESDADETFIRKLLLKHNIVGHFIRFNTKEEAERIKAGTQETARKLRYTWFEELRLLYNYDCILTAHHQTDNTETILINILRSTGVAGLHGIPLENGVIKRPLLFTSKAAISEFVKQNKLKFRKDASNDSDDYLRNRIRHHILPKLYDINGKADSAFSAVAAHVADFEKLNRDLIQHKASLHSKMKGDTLIISDSIFEGIEDKAVFMFHFLHSYGFSILELRKLLSEKGSKQAAFIRAGRWKLTRERSSLHLHPEKALAEALEINETGVYFSGTQEIEIGRMPGNEVDFSRKDIVYLDALKCSFPMQIRHWREADRMQPLGMKGTKKISDILTDRKVPSSVKKQQLLLVSHEGIVMALLPSVCSELYRLVNSDDEVLFVRSKSL